MIQQWIVLLGVGFVTAGISGGPIAVINVIPTDRSAESIRNAEPSIAVNPASTPNMVITAFANPGVDPDPVFLSSNTGNSWSNPYMIPFADVTTEWSAGGTAYLAPLVSNFSVQRSATPATGFTMIPGSTYASGGSGPDQPWLEVKNVSGVDRIYVGFNDLSKLNKTASIRYSLDAGATWTTIVIEKETPGAGQDSPAIRVAAANDGKTV